VRRYYSDRREQQAQTVGERYGEALANYQAGSSTSALDSLTELARAYPQVPMLQSTLGQALMGAGATDAALDTFRRALNLSPRNIPLTMRYAEALLKGGQAKTAHAVLLDLFNNVGPDRRRRSASRPGREQRRRQRRRGVLHERIPHRQRQPAAVRGPVGNGAGGAEHHRRAAQPLPGTPR
jgi:tetratricopeptide (TPR) repeat protein